MLDIPIKIDGDSCLLPTYAHSGDAGLDLKSSVDAVLEPLQRATIPCGFAMELPQGYAALVIPRSGLASKCGITVVNSPGLIDSGYRGEVKVVLLNTDGLEPFKISKGDRIAQMVILPLPQINLIETDELDDSARGTAGFGSSGIR